MFDIFDIEVNNRKIKNPFERVFWGAFALAVTYATFIFVGALFLLIGAILALPFILLFLLFK